jgi:hypothetical protein
MSKSEITGWIRGGDLKWHKAATREPGSRPGQFVVITAACGFRVANSQATVERLDKAPLCPTCK